MMSRYTHRLGTLGRLIALATLALALAAPLALGMAVGTAPTASAAGASSTLCGMAKSAKSAKSGCGPVPCVPVISADYNLPATSPRGGVRAWLSRTSGVGGSTDTLTGSGWPAGATVKLLLGARSHGSIQVAPIPFAQGRADASGHVIIAGFHTPGIENCMTKDDLNFGDNQALFVAQTPDARARISLLFTFFPPPALGPIAISGAVTAGQVITLSGSGWEPGQTVTITPAFQRWPADGYPSYSAIAFQPLPADATTVAARRDGTFTASATIPQEPPETQIAFFATANGPRNGEVSVLMNTIFSVLPLGATTLTLSRDTALAGAAVTVTGTNWPTGQDIQIEYCRGKVELCPNEISETLGAARADESGRITATVHIPANAQPGPITIQARPLTSPFGMTYYSQARPFAILYPFAQAHPRLALALRALPYAITALLVALLALGAWLLARRRQRLNPA